MRDRVADEIKQDIFNELTFTDKDKDKKIEDDMLYKKQELDESDFDYWPGDESGVEDVNTDNEEIIQNTVDSFSLDDFFDKIGGDFDWENRNLGIEHPEDMKYDPEYIIDSIRGYLSKDIFLNTDISLDSNKDGPLNLDAKKLFDDIVKPEMEKEGYTFDIIEESKFLQVTDNKNMINGHSVTVKNIDDRVLEVNIDSKKFNILRAFGRSADIVKNQYTSFPWKVQVNGKIGFANTNDDAVNMLVRLVTGDKNFKFTESSVNELFGFNKKPNIIINRRKENLIVIEINGKQYIVQRLVGVTDKLKYAGEFNKVWQFKINGKTAESDDPVSAVNMVVRTVTGNNNYNCGKIPDYEKLGENGVQTSFKDDIKRNPNLDSSDEEDELNCINELAVIKKLAGI